MRPFMQRQDSKKNKKLRSVKGFSNFFFASYSFLYKSFLHEAKFLICSSATDAANNWVICLQPILNVLPIFVLYYSLFSTNTTNSIHIIFLTFLICCYVLCEKQFTEVFVSTVILIFHLLLIHLNVPNKRRIYCIILVIFVVVK